MDHSKDLQFALKIALVIFLVFALIPVAILFLRKRKHSKNTEEIWKKKPFSTLDRTKFELAKAKQGENGWSVIKPHGYNVLLEKNVQLGEVKFEGRNYGSIKFKNEVYRFEISSLSFSASFGGKTGKQILNIHHKMETLLQINIFSSLISSQYSFCFKDLKFEIATSNNTIKVTKNLEIVALGTTNFFVGDPCIALARDLPDLIKMVIILTSLLR